MSNPIVITAGHSNTDSGAVNGARTEAHIVTDMRNMVAMYLRREGVDYRADGDSYENLPLRAAADLIAGSSVAVEFHCNAAASPRARGVEALCAAKDKRMAQKLCAPIARHLNTSLRGDKGYKPENSGQHSRLHFVQKGGIIVELFFISNDAELKRWDQVKWLIARDVAQVLIDSVGVECRP